MIRGQVYRHYAYDNYHNHNARHVLAASDAPASFSLPQSSCLHAIDELHGRRTLTRLRTMTFLSSD
jgi:hypothetical protein